MIGEDGNSRIEGLAEALGNADARIKHKNLDGSKVEIDIPNSGAHTEALQIILGELIAEHKPVAVGHRVVHGGDKFKSATVITLPMLLASKRLTPFILTCLRWRFLIQHFTKPCLTMLTAMPSPKSYTLSTKSAVMAFTAHRIITSQTVPMR